MLLSTIAAGGLACGALVGWLESATPLESFERYDPPEVTTLYDREGRPFAALFEQRRMLVRLRELPTIVPDSFVAIEDRNFHEHIGIDPYGLARAAVTNALRGSFTQGASTITQQLARNLDPSVGRDRTIWRKVREALTALRMERLYTKSQILELYLNHIYLGSGSYGIDAAARAYFGKAAAELDIAQAATLAGLPQLPERYSPRNNPEAAERRRDQVLGRLHVLGYITDAEFDAALRETVASPEEPLPSAATAPYFVDAVRRETIRDPLFDSEDLRTEGLAIRTSVDIGQQEAVERALLEGLQAEEAEFFRTRQERFAEFRATPEYAATPAPGQMRMGIVKRLFKNSIVVELPGGWRGDLPVPAGNSFYFSEESGIAPEQGIDLAVTEVDSTRRIFRGRLLPQTPVQGAAVVIHSASGEVRAIVGGRHFSERSSNGAFNRALLARRQAGSTLKPLFFGLALDRGFSTASVIVDEPIVFPDGYAPRNYEGRFFGPQTLEEALAHSRNASTIQLVRSMGLRRSLDGIAAFQRYGTDWNLPLEWPVVLGSVGVTPLEIAAAYQTIANGGIARGPRIVSGIWNDEGRDTLWSDGRTSKQLLSPAAAAGLMQMLVATMTDGTGRSTRELLPPDLRNRVAGKTGTTNDNRDVWFAGIIPEETLVVWMGFDDNIPLGPGRTGGRAAGPVWARIATALWELKPPEDRARVLPMPEGWHLAALDRNTGGEFHEGSPDPPRFVARQGEETPVLPVPLEIAGP